MKNGGDQTIVKQTAQASIHENDVISFYSSDPALSGAVNTHRVVSIETDGNNYRYITKGDANNVVDRLMWTQETCLAGWCGRHSYLAR